MEIVMIGHSNSGKTSYMAALYQCMKNGIYDYTMKYDDWDNYMHRHYYQNRKYYQWEDAKQEKRELDKLGNNIVQGIYPPSTAIRQEYLFSLAYKKYSPVKFSWFDYRGGALMERASSNEDASNLMQKVHDSMALIVFLDGEKMMEGPQKHEREFRRLIYIVRNAIANTNSDEGHYYPISFVITKADLCPDVMNSEGVRYFNTHLFNEICDSKRVAAMLTCVIIKKGCVQNVHWPLFHSILHSMHIYVQETANAYKTREENRGFFDSIKEFFTDEDKNYTIGILNQMEQSIDYLQKIILEQNKKSLILF